MSEFTPSSTNTTELEAQAQVLINMLELLKTIRRLLEPIATQDAGQRQRVVVESLTGINGVMGYQNITQINTITNGATPPTQGTGIVNMVWEAPVDQRYRVADASRTMAYIQRQNITFS